MSLNNKVVNVQCVTLKVTKGKKVFRTHIDVRGKGVVEWESRTWGRGGGGLAGGWKKSFARWWPMNPKGAGGARRVGGCRFQDSGGELPPYDSVCMTLKLLETLGKVGHCRRQLIQ